MATFGLLESGDEDALHASRLLNQEEKLYKRINKRLLASDSLVSTAKIQQQQIATPPPEGDDETEASAQKQEQERIRYQWRDEAILDFAAFESNIVRAHFLLQSNGQERNRYAEEKIKILKTAAAIQDNNTQLHEQLKEAQQTLETRKTYDQLAEKITNNRALKPREDQHAQLDKLNAEIAELERESAEYTKTWAERREQFNRIVEEGRQLLRLIRDEKEEAERKEGMEDIEDGDDSIKAAISAVGTPRPVDDAATAGEVLENDIPLLSHPAAKDKLLSDSSKENASQAESPVVGSELRQTDQKGAARDRDVDSADEVEEGEALESEVPETEKMDVT